jgi:hypothetical protein
MISFRFHVVSITAVFLAIAIGVVVGTTYVDRAVVDSLENRVDRVSRNLDERKAENDALEAELDQTRAYAEISADFAVTDRLTGVPVLLLAARGVDEDVAAQTLALARRAGAVVPGITWLEERWSLESDEDRASLATATGIEDQGSSGAVRGAALNALTAALGAAADPAIAKGVLTALVDGGFLSVDAQDDGAPRLDVLAGASPRVLLLTGTDASDRVTPAAAQMVDRASAAGLPTVAAEAFVQRSDGPERGRGFARTMEDDVRDRIVLVDDAELPQGRVAAILALVEVAAGRVGHFGYGADADGIIPAWTTP